MPYFSVVYMAGMLSLRSGWLPFHQEKGKSPSGGEEVLIIIGKTVCFVVPPRHDDNGRKQH